MSKLVTLSVNTLTSETFNPINDTSIIQFETSEDFDGFVYLQFKAPGLNVWENVVYFSEDAGIPISTPDVNVEYRFTSQINDGSVICYFGA